LSKDNKSTDDEKIALLEKEGSKLGAEERVKREFLSYFKKVEDKISFGSQLEKVYDLLVSGKLTKRDKAIVIGALIYFINPIDLIPDFTPFIGYVDDMAVLALAFRYLSHRATEELKNDKKDKDDDKPK
jgi:uncharacterized membrane protein YkvA (DUF1232 family)